MNAFHSSLKGIHDFLNPIQNVADAAAMSFVEGIMAAVDVIVDCRDLHPAPPASSLALVGAPPAALIPPTLTLLSAPSHRLARWTSWRRAGAGDQVPQRVVNDAGRVIAVLQYWIWV